MRAMLAITSSILEANNREGLLISHGLLSLIIVQKMIEHNGYDGRKGETS